MGRNKFFRYYYFVNCVRHEPGFGAMIMSNLGKSCYNVRDAEWCTCLVVVSLLVADWNEHPSSCLSDLRI